METPFTDDDTPLLHEAMMGPNAMRITQELASFLALAPGMRVLDLGCGMGLSSILLARQYGVTVFAADLWIAPTDNAARFTRLGLGDRIIPLSIDATKPLPFAHGYFDVLLCVDAYHYFGATDAALPSLLPYVKTGGRIAVAMPGLQAEFPGGRVPAQLQPFWQAGMENLHSREWWQALWQKTPGLAIESCRDMECCRQAWADWLQCPNPYAQGDAPLIEAEGGKYFSLVQIVGRKSA